jgi:hypothetical protein
MVIHSLRLPPTRHPSDWTRERIAKLAREEVEQLRTNAAQLGEITVVALCDDALKSRPAKRRREKR